MRIDTSFSDRKLTAEEFQEKYWLGGQAPYQYHTASIEDGRDEREQFVFNNIRALHDIRKWDKNWQQNMISEVEKQMEKQSGSLKKIAILAATSMATNVLLIIVSYLLWNKV